jgi:DNA polymerase III epsilon subunit-like protein
MEIRDLDTAKRAATLLEEGFVLLDLETTGLTNDPTVAIVEVGILSHRDEVLLETFVNPERRIPSAAQAVHGITDEDVADAPSFREIYSQIAEHVNNQTVVTYNAPFEQKVLAAVYPRYNTLPLKPRKWVCAMRLYTDFRWITNRYYTLSDACEQEGITIHDTHRAIGDCRLTLALMRRVAEYAREAG